jgi:hypothetical protein
MREKEPRPLAEVIFGPAGGTSPPGADLPEAIGAWYRTWRPRVRDPASSSRSAARQREEDKRYGVDGWVNPS